MENILPDKFYEFVSGWNDNIDFDQESKLLLNALDNAKKENDIQKYIKDNKKWFIPASIFEDYDFGHHEAYIVPEQALGSEYRVDYMLLGKNSMGYHVIFVEFEDVNTDFILKNSNTESDSVRKGLTQIRDWQLWIDSNKEYFFRSCGIDKIANNIPSWGINYCLVVSRRNRMDDRANSLRGTLMNNYRELKIISYDRLVDNVKRLVNGF